MQKNLKWLKLDNAAKIYPAVRRKDWTNVFRLSVTFRDEIEADKLQKALDNTVKRFPSVAVRMKTGLFWYYLEEIPQAPKIFNEAERSLNRMTFSSIRKCAFRVLYYKNRMSVELFHSVTDGNGGLVFTKTLAAEYTRLKYNISVPCGDGILDIKEEPRASELEDSFDKYDAPVATSRKEEHAYLLSGTPEPDSFLHLTCGILDTASVLEMSKKYGVTLTVYLSAVMMNAIYEIQNEKVANHRRKKPVKILIPVNLRKLFKSETMRNFAQYITPGIDPRLGNYTFEEMLKAIHHKLGLDLNPKTMAAKFTTNVRNERSKFLRVMPLFIKNIAMRMVYNAVGERTSSICLSNLGAVNLPPELECYVERIDFILGVQADSPCNCGVCSYGGKLYINFIRGIKESDLERKFFTFLRKQGLHVYIESNGR